MKGAQNDRGKIEVPKIIEVQRQYLEWQFEI